ncbi:GtrA family protein [Phenylobacterium sp. J426]|uniref:GtrA family protein n=1 Tax=Phenylobacterium sp. J426 TaxID=2898439 RepID=UPI00215081CF|nr:GtrA family protein [Phenylobacterium sp. J426]MCR5873073.1 GtrA family protein [Phenylobacterium sp. J426]
MRPVARQAVVFAAVGAAATGAHVAAALAFRHLAGLEPLAANLLAYLAAVAVSYLGNARLTFGRPALQGGQFLRFLVVSLFGLGVTQVLTWLLVVEAGWPFAAGLAVVAVVTPAATFTASKLWAFAGPYSSR